MKPKSIWLCAILFSLSISTPAQPQASDPIAESFFAPELVMQHQQAIGLTDEQKEFFKQVFRQAQTRFTEMQWQIQDEAEKMVRLVKLDSAIEQQVLAQLDKVLDLEREIKRLQVSLLIQIKNKLTPEQRTRLMELKPRSK